MNISKIKLPTISDFKTSPNSSVVFNKSSIVIDSVSSNTINKIKLPVSSCFLISKRTLTILIFGNFFIKSYDAEISDVDILIQQRSL